MPGGRKGPGAATEKHTTASHEGDISKLTGINTQSKLDINKTNQNAIRHEQERF